MKEWPKSGEERGKRAGHPQANTELHDNIILALGGVFYAILLAWPIYNLTTGSSSRPENFTVLGAILGLSLAACRDVKPRG